MPAPCNSCEVAIINGVRCHEISCPDAWRDERRECRWCGRTFSPDNPAKRCCDYGCCAAYNGLDAYDDGDTGDAGREAF